jgi:DNA helicase-2/ATP-dependent DNA helicase PcrA
MEDILTDLSPIQRDAVTHIDGPNLIIAGAGSGKTRVLTYKIAYMMRNNVAPSSVLALTFTNKAAKEMKERIVQIAGKQANKLWMGTFHSIFSRILRAEAEIIGFKPDYTIYDTADSMNIIKDIVKEMNLNDKIYKERDVYNRISMAKNYMITPASYALNMQLLAEDSQSFKPKISGIYQKYFMKCRNSNAMDFDDLLLYTNVLFRDKPDVLNKYQKCFKYILVDEYQDTNLAQYFIIKRLTGMAQNITIVGDDAQSIYSFRGAQIENMLNFRNDFPNYAEYKLEQNYRSTQTIVNAANSLIAKNEMQLKKTCFSKGEVGENIDIIRAFTDQEEGQIIASLIVDTVYGKQINYSDIAILYRTNAQSRIFEDSLRRRNIPYKIYGGVSFYQRTEIKNALAYMRLTINPLDDEALIRIINYPTRGIGNTTMDKIQMYATNNNISLWEAIGKLPTERRGNIKDSALKKITEFRELIESFIMKVNTEDAYSFTMNIIKQSGMMTDLKENKTPEGISRIENIEELLNSIKGYSKSLKRKDSIMISEYLQNISLMTDMDKDSTTSTNMVTLMTIHSSKGLEFGYVFIVGMEEGLFPGNNSMQTERSLEEERRLLYVALTRAAVKATISFAQTRYRWGNLTSAVPSRFLRDIDNSYISINSINNSIVAKKNLPLRQLYKKNEKPIDDNLNNLNNLKPILKLPPQAKVNGKYHIIPGMKVYHIRFGQGCVVGIDVDGDEVRIQIDFGSVGWKNLLLKFSQFAIIEDQNS